MLKHDLAGDHDAGHVLARGHLVHHGQQHFFHDGPQPSGAGAAQDGLVGHRLERVVGELQLDAVELEFTEDALESVADQAILRGTGARGLRAIMEEVLLSVMYEVPSRKDVAKVVVTREVVLEHVNPTLVPRETPKRERREKSA